MEITGELVKPKRGRKTKAETLKALALKNAIQQETNEIISEPVIQLNIEDKINEELENEVENEIENGFENEVVAPVMKKRGRKPKGGKIVQKNMLNLEQKEKKPNVILHLKCHISDLISENENNENAIEPFNFCTSKNELLYDVIYKAEIINNELPFQLNNNLDFSTEQNNYENKTDNTKEIWRKLKILEKSLHLNNLTDKKSACFWCSYDFDNTPIYIPKFYMKDSYHVYGCFCSPECATAHLMSESIDTSTKFERYHLLNHIYSKIYDYKKNIKPAPNPYYMLERFYGNLNIQEYRALLKSERLFLIVDKPLTRILPELHEDNDEFIINNKIIPSSTNNNFQVKRNILKKTTNKSTILQENFGIGLSSC